MGVVSVCSVLSVLALLLAWWASGFGPVLVDAFFCRVLVLFLGVAVPFSGFQAL